MSIIRRKFFAVLATSATLATGFLIGTPALAENTGTVNDTAQITIRNTNPKPAGDWKAGDEMQFQISLVNVSQNRFSAKVRSTNIEKGLAECVSNPSGWGNFKSIWEDRTAVSCTGSHIVTQDDINAKGFTPFVEFDKYAGCQDQTYADDGQCQLAHWQGAKTELDRFTADPIVIYPQHISAKMTVSVDENKDYQAGDTIPVNVSMTVLNVGNAKSILGPTDSASAGDATNLSIPANDKPCNYGDISAANTGEVKSCKPLNYVVTKEDLIRGEIKPYIDLQVKDATFGSGNAVQKVRVRATAKITHEWPAAEPNKAEYDADINLPAILDTAYTNRNNNAIAENIPDEGAYYRIPALVTANNGDLLAAYDYRPNMPADAPNPNSIVQRRSTDHGKTWEPETVVAAGLEGTAKYGYSDPSYVVDRDSGTLFVFHVKSFDVGFTAGKPIKENGKMNETDRNKIQLAVSKSTDNGYTWSTEVISADVLDPSPYVDGFGFATSGNGIQIKHGKHASRLVQQYAFSNKLADGTWRNVAVSVYSDNGGKTWQAGKPTPVVTDAKQQVAFDENKVVELSDGTLLLNSRTTYGDAKNYRLIAKSVDGGETWQAPSIEKQLTDPGNNASIIRPFPNALPGTPKSEVLLFSNAKNDAHRVQGTNRINGSVTVSYDDGTTWDNAHAWRFTEENEYVGYSTMAVQANGLIGLLHETAGGGIQYLNFSLAQALPADKVSALQLTGSGSYPKVSATAGQEFASEAPSLKTHAGAKITYSAQDLEQGLELNPQTGVVSGKIADAGDISVAVTALVTDGVESIEVPLTLAISTAEQDTAGTGGSGEDISGDGAGSGDIGSEGDGSGSAGSPEGNQPNPDQTDTSHGKQVSDSDSISDNLARTGAGAIILLALAGCFIAGGTGLTVRRHAQ